MSEDYESFPNNPQEEVNAWWAQALSEAGKGFRERLAVWAKSHPEQPAPVTPLTDFDRNFQQHVSPKLLNLITALAPLITRGVYSFSEAHSAVWRIARKAGAAHLSSTAQTEWLDWIASELVARLDDPWPDNLVTPERLAQITGEPR